MPQVVYYFSAYIDAVRLGRIRAGQKLNFSVPTGNFGDILAGYLALRMGLPVGKLICASNANNVLTDFIRTGVYDRRRPFHKTISPSMDILISSNLERLLYLMSGDSALVASLMEQLKEDRGITRSPPTCWKRIQDQFCAYCCDDAGTKGAISDGLVAKRLSHGHAYRRRLAGGAGVQAAAKAPRWCSPRPRPTSSRRRFSPPSARACDGDEFAMMEPLEVRHEAYPCLKICEASKSVPSCTAMWLPPPTCWNT